MFIRTNRILVSFILLCLNSNVSFSANEEADPDEVFESFINVSNEILKDQKAQRNIEEERFLNLRNLGKRLTAEKSLNTHFLSAKRYRGKQLSVTPLCQAIWVNDLDLVKILLENGADVNGRNSKNVASDTTPLYIATGQEISYEIFKTLVVAGADPNMSTKLTDNVPLLISCDNQDIERTYDLLSCGADPNCSRQRNFTIETPLYIALTNFHDELVKTSDSLSSVFENVDMQLVVLLMLFDVRAPGDSFYKTQEANVMSKKILKTFNDLMLLLVSDTNPNSWVYRDKEGIVRPKKNIINIRSKKEAIRNIEPLDLWNAIVELNKQINLVMFLERAIKRNLKERAEQQQEVVLRPRSFWSCFCFNRGEIDPEALEALDWFDPLSKVLVKALNNDSNERRETFKFAKSAKRAQ